MSEPTPTEADLVVLSLLLERPMHGYDLQQEYDRQEVRDWASVSKSQIYYSLGKLAKRGLLAARNEDGGERRTVYEVTAEGRAALATGLTDPAWATRRRPVPFHTWLGLSIHAEPEAAATMRAARIAFLAKEIEREERSLVEIETLAGPRADVGREAIRITLATLRAELECLRIS